MSAQPWTTRRLLEWTADYFKGLGFENPRLETELLLEGESAQELLDGRLFQEFLNYCDYCIIPNWDRPLQDFLMKKSTATILSCRM